MMKLIKQIGTALAILQWLGCLYLTLGAIVRDSTTAAVCAEIAIILTVLTDYFVWKVLHRA